MFQLNCRILFLLLATVMATGCGKASKSTSSDDGELATNSDSTRKKIISVRRDVKDLAGNWVFVVTTQNPESRQVNDNYRWIIKFAKDASGKTVAEFVDNSQDKDSPNRAKIADTQVNGDSIRISFVAENPQSPAKFDFDGTFQQGIIRGTIKIPPSSLFMARLLSTEEDSLENYVAVALPPGSDTIQEKMKDPNAKSEEILEAIRDSSTSPLAQEVYKMMFNPAIQDKLDEPTLHTAIKDCLVSARIWGDRWEADVERIIGEDLVTGRRFVQLAIPHLDAAEQKLDPADETTKKEIQAYREAANVILQAAVIKSAGATDEARKAAFEALMNVLPNQPFNAEVLQVLAMYSEKAGQVDAAIEYLSRIVSLPLLEAMILQIQAGSPPDGNLPHEALKRLWIQKHGNEEGYSNFITEAYRREIEEYIASIQKKSPPASPADKSNRTVLIELFTGMRCPPCVAADIALAAIDKAYSKTQVIALRMHQHIPAPDGLVNQSSEERATFYNISSTPSIAVDGILMDPRFYAGPLQYAEGSYAVLRSVVESRLEQKTDVQIKLSASVTNGQLNVSADVTGIPESEIAACRLRLAVVEDEVETNSPMSTNGIRYREFVVREFLDGAKGIAPKKGELKYSSSTPIADIQQHISDYINRFEAGRKINFPDEVKPPVKGPLSLVAWVQSTARDPKMPGMPVLQAAVAPITGFGEAKPAHATEPSNASEPANEPESKNAATAPAAEVKSDTTSDTVSPTPATPK